MQKKKLFVLAFSLSLTTSFCTNSTQCLTSGQGCIEDQSLIQTREKVLMKKGGDLHKAEPVPYEKFLKADEYYKSDKCNGCRQNAKIGPEMLQTWQEHLEKFEGRTEEPSNKDFHLEEADLMEIHTQSQTKTISDVSLNPNRYKPGTPGGPWTDEEAMIIKAKIWRIFDMTTTETAREIAAMPNVGFAVKKWLGSSRMAASALRLAFHGCVRELDGTGGCDGCLYWDGIDKIWMDYIGQGSLPPNTRGVPNFNGGLGNVVRLFENIYTTTDYPKDAPKLKVSPQDSGKSRSDLWSFAGIVATEHGIHSNNMVCRDQAWEWPTIYPDSLDTNGFWGMHCVQKRGQPDCEVNVTRRAVFKSGRADCLVPKMYAKADSAAIEKELVIKRKDRCQEAGIELGIKIKFDPDNAPHCKDAATGKDIRHLSVWEKYGHGQDYYVDQPLLKPPRDLLYQCKDNGVVKTKEECVAAAEKVYMPYDGWDGVRTDRAKLPIPGCYVMNRVIHVSGAYQSRVYWGEGEDYDVMTFGSPYGYSSVRGLCRMPTQSVEPYMAATWGHEPNSQKGGDFTVKWFKSEFDLTPRQSVAIMASHTMGRFHATRNLFRYIWIRNGGALFNNEYFRNLASRRDYRFFDDCGQVGSAYGEPPASRWRPGARGEMKTGGPVSWTLDRHICAIDCRSHRMAMALRFRKGLTEKCCGDDLPDNAMCLPDNNRTKGGDPVDDDLAPNSGCELFHTEGGNHEIALPAEIGLMYKFTERINDYPHYCQGFEQGKQDGPTHDSGLGCPLQDYPAGEGGKKLYEIVEEYADDQNRMANDFFDALEKTVENGVERSTMVEVPDVYTDVVCPNHHKVIDKAMKYGFCFKRSELSKPFLLISEMDHQLMTVSDGGQLRLQGFRNVSYLQDEEEMKKLNPRWKWHTVKDSDTGELQLVNGVPEYSVGRLVVTRTHALYNPGNAFKLSRNWAGHKPDLLFGGGAGTPQMQRFIRPLYFRPDQLSEPFLLISELDQRALRVNTETGMLDIVKNRSQWMMDALKDKKNLKNAPPEVVWYTVDTKWGKQLVNGHAHAGFGGRISWDVETATIKSEIGIVSRNFKDQLPEIAYALPQAWTQMTQFRAPVYSQGAIEDPFVIFSGYDRCLLEVNDEHYGLQIREFDAEILRSKRKIRDLPLGAQWYAFETPEGYQLMNGLVHGLLGKLIVDQELSQLRGLNGVLARHWDSASEKHVVAWKETATGAAPEWFTWHRPVYHPKEELSQPFVLVSESDYRVLQTNVHDGSIEMGEKRDLRYFNDFEYLKKMPLNMIWYYMSVKSAKVKPAKMKKGKKDPPLLVNGAVACAIGFFRYEHQGGSIRAGNRSLNTHRNQYLIRSWKGDLTFTDEYSWTNEGQRWLHSMYVDPSRLKDPFPLISEKDHRMLQVNMEKGTVEMGPMRSPEVVQSQEGVKDLATNLKWYLVDTLYGAQLFNGFGMACMGILLYDNVTASVKAGRGYLSRFVDPTIDQVVYSPEASSAGFFYKPFYIPEELLSPASVLISKMDNRLLRISLTGVWHVSEEPWDPEIVLSYRRVRELHMGTKWFIRRDKGSHNQLYLINGLLRYIGEYVYDGRRIKGPKGYMTRNWKGWKPTIVWNAAPLPGNRQIFVEPRNA